MIMEVSLEPLMVEDTFSPCDGKVWEWIDGRLQRIEPTVDVMAVAKVSATAVATVVEAEMSEVVVYGRWPSQQGNAAYMQLACSWEAACDGGQAADASVAMGGGSQATSWACATGDI